MRRPLFSLLLCLPVVFGAIFLGVDQPGADSSSTPTPHLPPDGAGARTAHATAEFSTPSDTADVHCPVGPKHGDATIQMDSTGEIPRTVTVKPDSQLATEFNIELADEMKLVAQTDLNQDDRPDPVIKAQYEGRIRMNIDRPYMAFVGCGGNRYVSVTSPLPLDMDRVHEQLSSGTTWPDLTTLKEVNLAKKLKGYYYYQTYRFDEEKERYQLVPGSAQYRKESARRLGIDPNDRPKCTVGEGPPIRMQPTEEDQKSLYPGDSVRVKPAYNPKIYEIEWIGDLNQNGQKDVILKDNCSKEDNSCSYRGYSKCKKGGRYYQEVLGEIETGEIKILQDRSKNSWSKIEIKGHITERKIILEFDIFGYKEESKSYY